MDRISKQKRSWNMSRIRSNDTGPERSVRSLLHSMGFRYRLRHSRKLPGRPDIILPRHNTVVFVHGCFWHRHPGCRLAYEPKSRKEFWSVKFQGNISRDRKAIQNLKKLGWQVIVVWECEIKNNERLSGKLRRIVRDTGKRH